MRSDRTSPAVRVPIYRGDTVVDHALVDIDDARLASQRWAMHPVGYAQGMGGILMHRLILGLSKGDGLEVDHVNRNKLDNRRANLRIIAHAENRQNNSPSGNLTWRGRPTSSAYRGVSWDKRRGKWKATVTVGCQTQHLGRFDTEEEAHARAVAFRAEHMPFAT